MAYREPSEPIGGQGTTVFDRPTSNVAAETQERPTTPPALERPPSVPALRPAEPSAPASTAKPKGRKRLVLALVLALAGSFGGYKGYGWWTTGRFMITTDDAYVQADITVLSAKLTGYVAGVEVTNNQSVHAGDVIARMDDGDYKLAVQSARDKLATQRATVERIGRQIEAAQASVAQAAPLVESARAEVVRVTADFNRQQALAQSDYVSRARFEQAKADFDRAQASLKGAQAGLTAAQANVPVLSAQRTEAQRVASELQTALDRAERDLSFTVIRAPVDGVIGNKAVETGMFVQPGTRLAALVPLGSVRVDANFKETQLASVQPGQKVEFEVDAFPGREFPGRVESISPASGAQFSLLPPENATGNFTKIVQRVPVRVAVDPQVAQEALLRPGLSVVVRVDSRHRTAVEDAGQGHGS